MRSLQAPSRVYVYFTLFLGLVLILMPFPFSYILPNFLLLILLAWVVRLPAMIGVGTAFFLGILVDLAQGTLLGLHALIYTIIAYCVLRFLPRLATLPVWQQSLIIFVLVMFHSALQYWLMSIEGVAPNSWTYWFPAISSMVVWPLVWKI